MFAEAEQLLTQCEREIVARKFLLPMDLRLKIWEKKGLALLHLRRIQEASAYFAEGYRLAGDQNEGPPLTEEAIRFLNDLAQIQIVTGHDTEAIQKFLKARELANRLDKRARLTITNNDLGYVYYQKGQFDEARLILESDLKEYAQLNHREPLARTFYALAECYREMNRRDQAIQYYQRCLDISVEDGLWPMLMRTYNGLGNIYWLESQWDEALQNYQRALEIAVRLQDQSTKAALLVNQGILYRKLDNHRQASRRFLLAKQVLEHGKNRLNFEEQLLSKCLRELAGLARHEAQPLKALAYQMEQIELLKRHDAQHEAYLEARLDLLSLYLENRLMDKFEAELCELKALPLLPKMAEAVLRLENEYEQMKVLDHESTIRTEAIGNS